MKYADKLKSYVGIEGDFSASDCSLRFPAINRDIMSTGLIKEIGENFVVISIKEPPLSPNQTRAYEIREYVLPLNLFKLVILEKIPATHY
ncbi:MAG TPA: hypothetical protein VGC97_15475 [Pyrinomonadaceae bacterium]|jgi:hypothetical protein